MAAALKEAPQEWRRHFPVERAPGRKLQDEFDAILGRLHKKLTAWHAHNAAQKQSLIRKAEQLLALEDGREAVESIKRLQAQWKDVGAAHAIKSGRYGMNFGGTAMRCFASGNRRTRISPLLFGEPSASSGAL